MSLPVSGQSGRAEGASTVAEAQTSLAARPKAYEYVEILREHLGGSYAAAFNGKLIYPRQLEVHLPADRSIACDFKCFYCQGGALRQDLGNWEEKGLRLMEQLQGAIPYYIYGGAYTEPLLNKYLIDYLRLTKKYNNNFGIHCNGSQLTRLQAESGFGSELIALADANLDYISVSLDAGTVESHKLTKNIRYDAFTGIIEGLRQLVQLRGAKRFPIIRVCYLMNRFNSSPQEIAGIVAIMREIGVNSLRFSVPYDLYGKSFDRVRRYRNNIEIPFGNACAEIVRPHLSKSFSEVPYVFWHPPGYQDVEKMTFKQCIYSYYQITFGADGKVYKCSSTASPSFDKNQLGEVTDDLEEFKRMVVANHNPDWDAHTCFSHGARCNRIALEINDLWNKNQLT